MSTVQSKVRKKFPRLTSSAFEHPADKAALDAVKKIPVIDKVFRRLLELGIERVIRIQLLWSSHSCHAQAMRQSLPALQRSLRHS